jgi:uncharacterized protein (UPF0333 family)
MAKIERRLFEGLNFHHYKELQEDTSIEAVAAIANAAVVAAAAAAATVSSDVGSTSTSTSKFMGVCYNIRQNKWTARIQVGGVSKFLEHFNNQKRCWVCLSSSGTLTL